jgi:hypothetical protein
MPQLVHKVFPGTGGVSRSQERMLSTWRFLHEETIGVVTARQSSILGAGVGRQDGSRALGQDWTGHVGSRRRFGHLASLPTGCHTCNMHEHFVVSSCNIKGGLMLCRKGGSS